MIGTPVNDDREGDDREEMIVMQNGTSGDTAHSPTQHTAWSVC